MNGHTLTGFNAKPTIKSYDFDCGSENVARVRPKAQEMEGEVKG